MSEFVPTVSEGLYPEDAGWTKDNATNVLLLSIPMLTDLIDVKINKFDYTWLFNEELDSYILCVRLQKEQEFAVIFHKEHAGRLLMESEADEEFAIIITDLSFDEIKEESPYITLPKISLERQSIAGW